MNPNVWQYLVLLEGIASVGLAVGLAQESLRREPLKLVGYANVGVALIALSVVASVGANLDESPTSATWFALAGFAIYFVAALGSWLHGLQRIARFRDLGHGRT